MPLRCSYEEAGRGRYTESIRVHPQQTWEQQADLLTIFGIFGEPLLATERFVRMIGRERLMGSDLIDGEEQTGDSERQRI